MRFPRLLRLFLAALLTTVAGCGVIGGGESRVASNNGLQQNAAASEVSELRSQLAAESQRATRAETEAQRARAEADWLAQAAQDEPGLRARNAELEQEIAELKAANKRVGVLEANLRDVEAENDQLSRALRGDWSEAPTPQTSTSTSLIEPIPAEMVTEGAETVPEGTEQDPAPSVPNAVDYGAGAYAVHLASYRSEEETLDGWLRLRTRYPDLLKNLSGHFAIFDIASLGGRYYRLKAGPFDGPDGAQSLCRRLSSAGQYCVVSDFDGELLQE